jgi:hypothetical protein
VRLDVVDCLLVHSGSGFLGGEVPVVTDGPYGETKELFGGFFLLDVASKQEAVEWAKRVPAAPGSKIEVRRVPGSDEVPQVNE